MVALGFALFASHGATVEGYALNDLMSFFGWINALDQRMVPSVDFPIPVGVLAHILPWLGSQISGQFAGAMEWAGVLVAAVLLALACIALRGRASAPVAALFLVAVFGLSCVPWNPGDGAGVVSHVGFYNRWGWAALAVLMLLGCSGQERNGRRWLADAVVVAFVLPFLFFLKMTYFLAAFAFVVGFGLLLRRFPKAAVTGLAAFLGVVLAAQATAGYVLPYLQQLGGAVQATGLVWRDVLLINLPLILPLCVLAAVACILTVRRKSALPDAAMPLFGLAACVLLGDSECPFGLRFCAGTRVRSGVRLGLGRQSALVPPFAAGHVSPGVGLDVRLPAAAVRCPSSRRGLPCEHSALRRQWIRRCMTSSLGIDDVKICKGGEKLSRSAAV